MRVRFRTLRGDEPTQNGYTQAISALSRSGWSQRRIARELDIDRETVARYRQMARQAEAPKPAIPPAGSGVGLEPDPAIVPAGPETTAGSASDPDAAPKPAIVPTGSKQGRVSHCAPFEAIIQAGLDCHRADQNRPV